MFVCLLSRPTQRWNSDHHEIQCWLIQIKLQMIHNIPQPAFEAFVAERLKDDPNVETRKGIAFVSCVQVNPTIHIITITRN